MTRHRLKNEVKCSNSLIGQALGKQLKTSEEQRDKQKQATDK